MPASWKGEVERNERKKRKKEKSRLATESDTVGLRLGFCVWDRKFKRGVGIKSRKDLETEEEVGRKIEAFLMCS